MWTIPTPRWRLREGILVVALVALSLGLLVQRWAAQERLEHLRGNASLLSADVQRCFDRVLWSRRMREKGYVSESEVVKSEESLRVAIQELAKIPQIPH